MSGSSAVVNATSAIRKKKEKVYIEHEGIILGPSSNPVSHIFATAIQTP